MGKQLDSKYLPGKRSRDWLKFKTHGEQEFVIVGYTKGKRRREWSFGSLVLATNGPEGLSGSATSAPASTTPSRSGC